MNQSKKYTKLSPMRFPDYGEGKIVRAYMLENGDIVGYCAATHEWLKWNAKNQLHVSFRRTRDAAAQLGGYGPANWVDINARGNATEPATEPAPERFTPRYFNLAAITSTASTISAQSWVTSQQDIYDAEARLLKWTSPDEERWHGKVVRAALFDTHTKQLRHFVRDERNQLLREVQS